MAVYKVPQDVEADDKLIGPFSFRQFIYLIIVAVSIAAAWGLFMLLPPLVIIPLPVILFFGALALPLRKDQPMEVYLAAVLSYYLKPRKRLWVPDGKESLIEITAPKTVEVQRTKNLSQDEAEQRLSYLANLVDTHGWAVRGVNGAPQANTPMNSDIYFEAQQTEDVLDESNTVSQNLNYMIEQNDARRHQEMLERLRSSASPQAQAPLPTYTPPDPYQALAPAQATPPLPQTMPQTTQAPAPNTQAAPQATQAPEPHLQYNPYPTSMNQTVIQPLSQQIQTPEPAAQAPAQTIQAPEPTATPDTSTSENTISPDIINLANNTDLSIETIAREANRIHEKEEASHEDEVIISLR